MSKESVVRNNIWKWLILALLAAVSVHVTCPMKDVKNDAGEVVERGKVRLGLDLSGGTSFTLGVDIDKLRETIIAADPAITNIADGVEKEVKRRLEGCDERITSVIRKRVDAMGTNEPVIQSLPKKHQLIVQLPGADEALRKEAKARLQNMAFLEFRLTHPREHELIAKCLASESCPEGYVKKGNGYARAADWAERIKTPGYAARLASFMTTDDRYRFMLQDAKNGTFLPHFVSRNVELTGDSFESASWSRDTVRGGFVVNFSLNAEGGTKFRQLTRSYMPNGLKNHTSKGRCLAIILDDILISAPEIKAEIGNEGVIEGNFDIAEARQLASDLNAGALPAPLRILAESSVAPTVGEDAIHSGIWAAAIGFALVAVFMFIYYWFAGLVADIALFLDIVLLPTALVIVANVLGVFARDPSMGGGGSVQLPVLTMPGIAGLVLTLGMAVDANVLIFERIREEFQRGQTAGKAVKNGYGRAFTAIFDSNITTIITGIILFVVGTGPVRGFAITLTAGVVISMFTALVATRLVFDHVVDPERVKPFRMLQAFKAPNFDFMKYGNKTLLASAVVVVVSLSIFGIRLARNPASVLAVDLTGGTSIVYDLTQEESKQPAVGDIRAALAEFDNAPVIQYQRGVGNTTLLVKTGESAETAKGRTVENRDVGAHVTKLLAAKFPEAQLVPASVEEVGSMVGDDLKKSGRNAVLFSLVAILVYVGFRFQFGFGLGGLVALAHDALISLGLFSLCGRQVSLIVVTALLTIIGYSINDTVVVFDRIREQLRRDAKTPFRDLCNQAINACLGRTVITSVTTFFAVAALFAFGDGSIFDFALTMLIGVVAGTYSSVFIATPIMAWWYRDKRPEFDAEEKKAEA
ncbi:MAG: protein translocase subunit SecD [Kiritimatiellae bacterium]|nr:protein translocase subunit SecD [Kiritimatiellia bacterium]